jgi:hypothetical protein
LIVIVSGEHNPASAFVCVLKSQAGTHSISGEGNGESTVSDTAGGAIEKTTTAELAALPAATKCTAARP